MKECKKKERGTTERKEKLYWEEGKKKNRKGNDGKEGAILRGRKNNKIYQKQRQCFVLAHGSLKKELAENRQEMREWMEDKKEEKKV